MNCKKCNGKMKPGQAMQSTMRGGVTMHEGGPGRLIGCLKCEGCGHSVVATTPAKHVVRQQMGTKEEIREAARRVIEKHREVLERLKER